MSDAERQRRRRAKLRNNVTPRLEYRDTEKPRDNVTPPEFRDIERQRQQIRESFRDESPIRPEEILARAEGFLKGRENQMLDALIALAGLLTEIADQFQDDDAFGVWLDNTYSYTEGYRVLIEMFRDLGPAEMRKGLVIHWENFPNDYSDQLFQNL